MGWTKRGLVVAILAGVVGWGAPAGAAGGQRAVAPARWTRTTEVTPPGEAPFSHVRDDELVSRSLPPDMAVDPEAGPAGTPGSVERFAGDDRIATAIVASQRLYAADGAGAVVLARADTFPDALVGGPLAHHVAGPLLLTGRSTLDPRVRAEIDRALEPGDRVLLLGGIEALALPIETELNAAGYTVRRFAGGTRYATAVAVALGMGAPTDVLLADGTNFPDALVAGAAAASVGAAVLLTNGSVLPTETATYLDVAGAPIAIGGPAAAAVPGAPSIVGPDRYRTAIGVAGQFFGATDVVGVATGQNFPDALAGAAHIAAVGGPLLLTPGELLDADVAAYLEFLDDPTQVFVYGGFSAISLNAEVGIRSAVGAPILVE